MENKENKQKKIGRLNARWVLVFSCALILCVMITFGFTMAYYGGKSNGLTGQFTLKSGIEFKENVTGTDYQKVDIGSDYMVPGTVLNPFCLVTVTSGIADFLNTSVNGLLRASFSTDGDMKDFVTVQDGVYDVYMGSTQADMTDTNHIGRLIKAEDGYYYLVKDKTATTITNDTLLYEIPCKSYSGQVSLVFNMTININNASSADSSVEFENSHMGKTASFVGSFQVIQAEFYDAEFEGGLNPMDQTYENAKPLFDNPTASES